MSGTLEIVQTLSAPAGTVSLLDLPVHSLTLDEAVEHLCTAIERREPTTVVSLNGALAVQALSDSSLAAVVRGAGLVIPDGVGVLMAARILGVPVRRRVAGVDLAEALCRAAAVRGYRVYLLGAAPGVAQAAAERLQARYAGLKVVGTGHGFFGPDDEHEVIDAVRAVRPDILLLAIGAPRQEWWLHRTASRLGVPVMMGVGGTLDVLAGRTRRAPRWMQAAGLEWFYRLVREPWRWSVVRTIPPLFMVALRERLRRFAWRLAGAGLHRLAWRLSSAGLHARRQAHPGSQGGDRPHNRRTVP